MTGLFYLMTIQGDGGKTTEEGYGGWYTEAPLPEPLQVLTTLHTDLHTNRAAAPHYCRL